MKLNRAAEAATSRAKEVFWNAITDMSLDDAKRIYEGPKDTATQYFKGRMSGPLTNSMRPVVDSTLSEVCAIQEYDSMMGRYKAVPFVPDVKADLTTHVLERDLDALFLLSRARRGDDPGEPGEALDGIAAKSFRCRQLIVSKSR